MHLADQSLDFISQFSNLSIEPKERQTGLIEIHNMKWNQPECKLSQEFKHIYTSRIDKLQNRLNMPGLVKISQVIDNNQKYCIKGIIKRLEDFRVRAFEKKFSETYDNDKPIYNEKDELEIEDRTGKLKLVIRSETTLNNNKVISVCDLPYGVYVILQGKFHKLSNKFYVKNIILPSVAPQIKYQRNFVNEQGIHFANKRILVVSEPTHSQLLNISEIINSNCDRVKDITALVIVGGLEMKPEVITKMSEVIYELKDSIDVFIMPSTSLERQKLFPLPPYNGLFFVKSHRQVALCSNPQLFEAENRLKIHISCGQNVRDFMKNGSLVSSSIDVMQQMVNFSHYCPSSPFSLKTEPYIEDFLVIEELPHIMIAGKAQKFETKTLKYESKSVLLVAIPAGKMGLISLNGTEAEQLL